MPNMEVRKTARGFSRIEFTDRNDIACSLQKSSLATEDAIWLGCNNADPRVCVPGEGWQPAPLPQGHVANTRMHLTVDQVSELIPFLQKFVQTGELLLEAPDVNDGWNYVTDKPKPEHGGQVLVSYMMGKNGPFVDSARCEGVRWEFSGRNHDPGLEVFAWKEHVKAAAYPKA